MSLTYSEQVIRPRCTLTLNSNAPTPIPAAAPEPASPTKCSLPILLANNEAPTWETTHGQNHQHLVKKDNPWILHNYLPVFPIHHWELTFPLLRVITTKCLLQSHQNTTAHSTRNLDGTYWQPSHEPTSQEVSTDCSTVGFQHGLEKEEHWKFPLDQQSQIKHLQSFSTSSSIPPSPPEKKRTYPLPPYPI